MAEDLRVGQIVQLSDGRPAVIRFVGPAEFAPTGIWVGVELDDYSGKNDGSVKGERYFDCEQDRGMFVRPAAIRVVEQPSTVVPPPQPSIAVKKTSRPSSVVAPTAAKRMSSLADNGANKRASLNAPSPSPAGRRPSSMLRSPTKSPTKQLLSGSSTASTSRTGTPSNTRTSSTVGARPSLAAKRTSMGPPAVPASRAARPSLAPGGSRLSSVGSRTSVVSAQRVSSRPTANRITSLGSESSAPVSDGGMEDEDKVLSPDASDVSDGTLPKASSPLMTRAVPSSATSSRAPSSPGIQRAATTAGTREVEDMKAKMRIMEKRWMEDRESLKQFDKVKAERDKFEGIIQKLQLKYQPQQQEIAELRKQLKDAIAKLEDIENIQAEHDVTLEMATLDREMAEEQAEVYKFELEALKAKTEELELEVEVLREENEELGGEMSAEEKASQGWLQMERNNERLREALIRLRDITQQTEAELRGEIKALEAENAEFMSFKEHFDVVKQKLASSEATVEDLRQQLDNALGAEDMIEELTEKNMSMNEHIEELKITIQDLEDLKELNDELEINHIETEKDLQEEIEFKDAIISEQARRAAQQEQTLDDMEYTLSRFRELVINLQTDLEDMKATHAVTETESEQLSSRSKAMMDLNLKLQVSAAKTQFKAIDSELRRLEAQEASDHLEIVQLFLPDVYQSEKDSILALLRFKRVGFKANLLHGFMRDNINSQATQGHEDDLFAACDALDKLSWVSSMCDRFVNAISHCSSDQFAKYEGALYELEPVERALNAWIDALRKEELKQQQCAEELSRSIALMSHLAEVHISNGLESFADEVHMRALLMQSHLENTASALVAVKAMAANAVISKGDDDDGNELHFVKKLDTAIMATRSAKVVIGKALRSLEDLKARSLSLMPDTLPAFEHCEEGTQELANLARNIGFDLYKLLHEGGRAEPFSYGEIESTIITSVKATSSTDETELLSTFNTKLRTITAALGDIANLATDLSQTQEFERAIAPWVVRSQELKSSKTISVDAAEEMRKLKDESRERMRLIAMRDQMLEESHVKIELLESRMRDAIKKNEKIAELEKRIEEAKKRESDLAQTIEARDKELLTSEKEREKWKKVASEQKIVEVEPGSKEGREKAVATAREMDALREEIKALQAAVNYLREDNRLTKLHEPQTTQWLAEPLIKAKTPRQRRKELVSTEGNDVLNELLNLVKDSQVFDLTSLPKDKLAWRPAKTTPRFHVARQRENWEAWKSWSQGVIRKGEALSSRDVDVKIDWTQRDPPAARFQFKLPELDGKHGPGGEVRIVDPADFDALQNTLSVA